MIDQHKHIFGEKKKENGGKLAVIYEFRICFEW